MKKVVVVPARMASTRLPGKVLLKESGQPLVGHVVSRLRESKLADEILVATDHPDVEAALLPYDVSVLMTRDDHPSGTDRVWEAVQRVGGDLIVNVQADEPEIDPILVDQLFECLQAGADMATVVVPRERQHFPDDPSMVTVALSDDQRALYFSRSRIPHDRDQIDAPLYQHVGIYAYRRDTLQKIAEAKPSTLERTEMLEQLRALELGISIQTVITQNSWPSIDTPQEYQDFVTRIQSADPKEVS